MTHIFPRPFAVALLASISLMFVLGSFSSPEDGASASAPSKLGPGVQQAIAGGKSVRVIVSLQEPRALRAPPIDVRSLRSQVRSGQAAVLSDMPTSEFTQTSRYRAVPALAGVATPKGLEELQARPDVAQIALDGVGDAGMALTVPMIHANETFNAGVTGAGQTVAVIDTGIDTDHPDLADSIAYERCFITGGGCPPLPHVAEDDNGHGTNVAGVVTSNGTVAPRGVAPDATVAAYKVLSSSGNGLLSDWLSALDDIIAEHPEVDAVNMSLQSGIGCPNQALNTAVTTLHQMGVPVFIATGNHGNKSTFTVPACLTDAITVGAVYDSNIGSSPSLKSGCSDTITAADVVACWSDSSPDIDLLAPGAYVTSAGVGGGTSNYLGTSQAAPHAAALFALMRQSLPGLTLDVTVSRMKSGGTIITDDLDDFDPTTQRQTPRIDARVALLTDDNADYDGDGCTNGQEFGPDSAFGGQRNPLLQWDYMNPSGDGLNRIDDVLLAVNQYFIDEGEPGYNEATDRTYIGPYLWSLGPPNGLQRVDDIIAALNSYGDDCI